MKTYNTNAIVISKPLTSGTPLRRWLFLISLAACWLATSCATSSPARPEPATRLIPQAQKIVDGVVAVDAGKSVTYRVEVKPDMVEPVLKGSLTASGGGGNDVQAAIADETNIANWVNDHQASVLWQTPGKQTSSNFAVSLNPGTYYLAISNKFSLISDKTVTLDVNLGYKVREQDRP